MPPGDPRTRATIDAVDGELAEDGYAYRYRIDDRPLGESEGAFLVCGLWMALAWHEQGEPLRATRWFERSLAACGGPGIYAEEYDIAQRQLRGNCRRRSSRARPGVRGDPGLGGPGGEVRLLLGVHLLIGDAPGLGHGRDVRRGRPAE